MNLITGKLGRNHFTSTQHRNIFRSILGNGSLIASNVGAAMATSITGSNQISIENGLLFHHGCAFEIPFGEVETVEVSNGTQGYSRIDAIVLRWTKNSSGIESAEWTVIEGTPTTGTPTAPQITEGDMNTGDTQDDCLFALAKIEGVALSEVTVQVASRTISADVDWLAGQVAALQAKLARLPTVIKSGSGVTNGTTANDVTIWTIPAQYDMTKVVVDITNGAYNTNQVLEIATYIDSNRRVHARLDRAQASGYFRYNYIIWYIDNEVTGV